MNVKATVSVFAPPAASDGRMRVQVTTRASLPRMAHATLVKELRDAEINVCGVTLCDEGKYFDMIPRKSTKGGKEESETDDPPKKGDGVEGMKPVKLEERVLVALPKIFGENVEFELKTA